MTAQEHAIELFYRYYCKSVQCCTLFNDSYIQEAVKYIEELILLLDTFGEEEEIQYYNEVKQELLKLNIV